ncbi:MAG: SH3 domain-containing protein [Cyanobacteria bacterium J06633_8]
MLKAFMASALILGSTLTMSAPVTAQTQESVQATSYQVAQRRGSRAYVCTRDRNGYLNLRSGPSLRNRIIGRINNRQYLTILRSSGNWYKVRYRGRIGWVSGDFVCSGNSRNKIRLTMYINMYDGVYQTKTVYVSATRPVTDIVGKVLKEKYVFPRGIRLIDYKVTVRNRIARIYFIADESAKSFASLASSEMVKLESLNATLTRNSQLNINKVVLFVNGDRITPELFDF